MNIRKLIKRGRIADPDVGSTPEVPTTVVEKVETVVEKAKKIFTKKEK